MKSRKPLAAIALALSAGLTFTACSSAADNTSAEASASQSVTDEQKQKVESFVQDFYTKLTESKLSKPNEQQEAAYVKLRQTKGKTVEEISASIDKELTADEKSMLSEFLSSGNKTSDLIDTEELNDNEKLMLNMIVTRPTKLPYEDISKLKVDTSKVKFEGNTASVTSEAKTYDGKASKGSLPLDLKLVDGSWKLDGKKFLEAYIAKTTSKKTASATAEPSASESK